MEFRFETAYTPKSMAVMAKALRKTVRRKRSRRSHIFGVTVAVLGCILIFSASEFNFRLFITGAVVVILIAALIFEDHINGYFAYKRMLPGMDSSVVSFHEEGYHSETALGSSDFPYTNIQAIAETPQYYVFIFSASHGQIYDKRSITGGTCESFSEFISRKTDKRIISL